MSLDGDNIQFMLNREDTHNTFNLASGWKPDRNSITLRSCEANEHRKRIGMKPNVTEARHLEENPWYCSKRVFHIKVIGWWWPPIAMLPCCYCAGACAAAFRNRYRTPVNLVIENHRSQEILISICNAPAITCWRWRVFPKLWITVCGSICIVFGENVWLVVSSPKKMCMSRRWHFQEVLVTGWLNPIVGSKIAQSHFQLFPSMKYWWFDLSHQMHWNCPHLPDSINKR